MFKVIKKMHEVGTDRFIEVNKMKEIKRELNDYELDVYGNMREDKDLYFKNLLIGSLKFHFEQKDLKQASKLRFV